MSDGGPGGRDPDRLADAHGGAPLRAALVAALRWLARRARTTEEIRRRLLAAGFSAATVQAALDRLHRWGYLDDRRLAADAVERAAATGRVGPQRLRWELTGRGLDPEMVEPLLADGYPPEREEEWARSLARRRWRSRATAPSPEARRREAARMFRFLVRRGFHPEVAAAAVRDLLSADEAVDGCGPDGEQP